MQIVLERDRQVNANSHENVPRRQKVRNRNENRSGAAIMSDKSIKSAGRHESVGLNPPESAALQQG